MAEDLVTLAEYKAYAGISSTNQDTEIKAIIPKVSALIKSICRRTFVDYSCDVKTETFPIGLEKVYLSEFPIIMVTGVEYSTDYGATYTAFVEFTDYVLEPEEGSITFINYSSYTRMLNGIKVTYTGGYETADVPQDLKLAVMDGVTYYLKQSFSVKSQRDAGSNTVQIEYITKNTLPAHIQRVLDIYIADAS